MKYHAGEGFWFERLPDGSVNLKMRDGPDEDDGILEEITFPPNIWASLVSSMSREGENWQTWHDALERQKPEQCCGGECIPVKPELDFYENAGQEARVDRLSCLMKRRLAK